MGIRELTDPPPHTPPFHFPPALVACVCVYVWLITTMHRSSLLWHCTSGRMCVLGLVNETASEAFFMRMDGCRGSCCASSPPSPPLFSSPYPPLLLFFLSLPLLGPLSAPFSRFFFPLTSFSRPFPIKLFFFRFFILPFPFFFLFRSASIYGCILPCEPREPEQGQDYK